MTFFNTEEKITCIKFSKSCRIVYHSFYNKETILQIAAGTEDSKIHVWTYKQNLPTQTQSTLALSEYKDPKHVCSCFFDYVVVCPDWSYLDCL